MLHKLSKLRRLLRERGTLYAFHFSWYYLFLKVTDRWKALRKLFFVLAPYPQHLEIEVTTRCNLRCLMCEHTYWHEPGRDMTYEEFCSILAQFPTLRWLGLTGIGESLLNPDYLKMLSVAKSRLITVEISDPLHCATQDQVRQMVDMGVDRLFISFDAASADTYEKIRRGAHFDRVTENVRTLFQERAKRSDGLPEIFFHYVISKANVHEVLDAIRLVNELRQGQPTTIQFSRILHCYPQIQDFFIEVDPGLMDKATQVCRDLGVGLIWNKDVPERKPSIRECLAWIEPFIFVTGDVVPCCAGNEANQRDVQRAHRLGNVFMEPFSKIWRGEAYRALRKQIGSGCTPEACSSCTIYDVGQTP